VTELALTKTPSGALAPADEATQEFLRRIKIGGGLRADFKRMRNVRFHRKGFALLQFAFEMWDAPQIEYKGEPVAKEFNRFRKDLTILAGHYTTTVNLRGEVRLEAKSLNFGAMSDDEFEQVYKSLLGVIWDKVLKRKGFAAPGDVDNVVERLLNFE